MMMANAIGSLKQHSTGKLNAKLLQPLIQVIQLLIRQPLAGGFAIDCLDMAIQLFAAPAQPSDLAVDAGEQVRQIHRFGAQGIRCQLNWRATTTKLAGSTDSPLAT